MMPMGGSIWQRARFFQTLDLHGYGYETVKQGSIWPFVVRNPQTDQDILALI